jgi:hypothetical protein
MTNLDTRPDEDASKPKAEIHIQIDIFNKTISYDLNHLLFSDIQLFFGFTDDGKLPVEFTDMKFGYELTLEENDLIKMVEYDTWGGYIKTWEECLYNKNIKVDNDTLYTLTVWCYNNGERFSNKETFRITTWQNNFPVQHNVPRDETDPRYQMINVPDAWWI